MLTISKEYEFNAAIDAVWGVLTDIKKVTSCIPGIDDITIHDNGFNAHVKPPFSFIKGRFYIESSAKEARGREYLQIHVKGSSIGSRFEVNMGVALQEDKGYTVLKVDIGIEMHGLLKTVPNTLIRKVVNDLEGSILECIKEKISAVS